MLTISGRQSLNFDSDASLNDDIANRRLEMSIILFLCFKRLSKFNSPVLCLIFTVFFLSLFYLLTFLLHFFDNRNILKENSAACSYDSTGSLISNSYRPEMNSSHANEKFRKAVSFL